MTCGSTRTALAAVLGATLATFAACGGSPAGPGPAPPPPVPDPANTAPEIKSIAVSDVRPEVDTATDVTATVEDLETPIDRLQFEWTSDVGVFAGEGAAVKWQAPKGTPTPGDYVLTLTVVEPYTRRDETGQIVTGENRVSGSVSVRLHDSPKELGDMSLRFLNDFANSSVSPEACVREFSDTCPGKTQELNDIRDNRENYVILSSHLSLKSVVVAANRVHADMVVACQFTSRVKQTGQIGNAAGDCLLTGVYEQQRWWLCDSHFRSTGLLSPTMKLFFGRSLQ